MREPRRTQPRHLAAKLLTYAFLGIFTLVSLFPFYLMFVSSTLETGEILSASPRMFFGSNLAANWAHLGEKINTGRVLFNSLLIAGVYTGLTLFLDSLAGYALAKFRFRGRGVMFGVIILTLMIPNQVLLVPLFTMMNKLGWQNTYWAVILPSLANAFGIFLMRQNMLNFPDAVIESARIDGCGELRIFLRIVLPSMKPALGALGIYNFISQWGNFMWPLIILGTKDMYTFPVALASLSGLQRTDYGMVMLGSTLATIPIMVMFLVFQKQFVSGVMGGSVKG
jgi:lactose/L-arabinose transport system permease protein